jgi:hypothetical protein
MDKISKDKQYTTREGSEVRIYATEEVGLYPIHGAIKRSEGWISASWGSSGYVVSPCREMPDDLIEVKPRMKVERWIAIDSGGNASMFSERVTNGGPSLFAIKHIVFEVEEGEGLDAV